MPTGLAGFQGETDKFERTLVSGRVADAQPVRASAKSAINLDNGGAESVGTARPGQLPQHPEASVLGNLTT